MNGVKNLMDKPHLFDGRNMFGPEEMRTWGFNMRELGEDNSVEKLPLVSVIIPCRNEEKFIGKCLDSIINQDYPKDKLEVLVIDGMSEDRTANIVDRYIERYSFIKLLKNSKKITPVALNIGIKNARGEIIIRMDAHSTYREDYISKSVKYLQEYNADNVGGIWKIMPRENSLINKSICLASSSAFGAGNAYYRRGYDKGIKEVDTVFGGCYKKEIFKKIGLFNENLIRNQDLEFNLRLVRSGGKILLVPEIISYYYPKSNFKEFFVHNFKDGFWVTYPTKFGIKAFSWRHLIPLIFILGLVGNGILGIFLPIFLRLFLFISGLYILVNFYFSFKIAIKRKNLKYLFLMPIAFVSRHFGYALGSLWGFIKLAISELERDKNA